MSERSILLNGDLPATPEPPAHDASADECACAGCTTTRNAWREQDYSTIVRPNHMYLYGRVDNVQIAPWPRESSQVNQIAANAVTEAIANRARVARWWLDQAEVRTRETSEAYAMGLGYTRDPLNGDLLPPPGRALREYLDVTTHNDSYTRMMPVGRAAIEQFDYSPLSNLVEEHLQAARDRVAAQTRNMPGGESTLRIERSTTLWGVFVDVSMSILQALGNSMASLWRLKPRA